MVTLIMLEDKVQALTLIHVDCLGVHFLTRCLRYHFNVTKADEANKCESGFNIAFRGVK